MQATELRVGGPSEDGEVDSIERLSDNTSNDVEY